MHEDGKKELKEGMKEEKSLRGREEGGNEQGRNNSRGKRKGRKGTGAWPVEKGRKERTERE